MSQALIVLTILVVLSSKSQIMMGNAQEDSECHRTLSCRTKLLTVMGSQPGRSIIKAQDPIRPKGHPKCQIHKQNDVVISCQECRMLICITCSISTHKQHIDSFQELKKIETEQKQILQDFLNETDNVKIPKLNQEIVSSRTKMSSCKPMLDKLRKDIIDNKNQCKNQLDKLADDYISICDKMEVAAMDLIQTHITDLERRLDTLKKLSPDYKQALQTGTGVLVYDSVSEIREMDTDIPPTPDIQTDFTPGMDRQGHLKQALGNMKLPTDNLQPGATTSDHSAQNPVVQPKLSTEAGQASTRAVRFKLCDRPTVMSQFSYRDLITSICPTSDGRAWLSVYTSNTVKLMNKKGQVIQTIQYKGNILDISVDPTTGHLWFCCKIERTICEVSTSLTPVIRFIIDGYPNSLCVTRKGRVLVGTQSNKVLMYTVDGQVLHTHIVERSETGAVQSITQCGNTGNIAIVSGQLIRWDASNPYSFRRHIIVYNPTFQPLVYYRGEGIQAQVPVTPDNFDPWTVVYDSKGNIVIADRTRRAIELISGEGKYIKTLHTSKGNQGPIGIQKGDVLWANLELNACKLLKYYSD
ncbi:uncharacterized protein LOC117317984 [Pecten maximus]|uniref:uncharacterized protein LOC117317984 n=1 Tax=Pecten maximus TaxID=6579 RepID=UPI0014584A41|nr:uncharacterized protein LOC117317984 [Pecten maximus]